jgi:hypothetical protein
VNVILFVFCSILFVGSFLLFGFAFEFPAPIDQIMFVGGILGVSASFAIPFHLLTRTD